MYSVDFDEIEKLQHQDNWKETANILSKAAKSVELCGADFLLICTNTMHKVAPEIEKTISIPILHIADATAETLVKDGIKKVGLLGTKFTMEQDFYKNRLIDKFNIDVVIPNNKDMNTIHKIIYSELCVGSVSNTSREKYLEIINSLYINGAEAVILGCTEIALLVHQEHTSVRLYDTIRIHAHYAVEKSIT